jgi:hypothetical protein
VVRKADEFLVSIGYLQGKPTIESPDPAAQLVADEKP